MKKISAEDQQHIDNIQALEELYAKGVEKLIGTLLILYLNDKYSSKIHQRACSTICRLARHDRPKWQEAIETKLHAMLKPDITITKTSTILKSLLCIEASSEVRSGIAQTEWIINHTSSTVRNEAANLYLGLFHPNQRRVFVATLSWEGHSQWS